MIKVMLADDQAMVRGALSALLSLESDIEVVADVGDGSEVMEVASVACPDVILMDV
ncbi:TPA: DNA-binding response regulator, partial [Corynebacterium striatum]|nr:DNA-binding response regulator [Corynebacterium striatum]